MSRRSKKIGCSIEGYWGDKYYVELSPFDFEKVQEMELGDAWWYIINHTNAKPMMYEFSIGENRYPRWEPDKFTV